MKTLIRFVAIAVITGSLVLRASVANRALPQFDVVSADGATVSSTAFADGNKWLLIYIRPACAPCDGVIDLWSGGDPPMPASRVRVIAGAATAGTLPQIEARYPMLKGAVWYADSTGAAARALALTGAPAIYAIRGQRIAWTSQGLLPITRSQISGWTR